ncbi:MAG TPA: DUF3883 domain-containing protein [Flavisolibacter sp.]|jgi:hypothetical protein|nr:DUF3883 domain-containing protein [Flavisolibacter sp.]
MIEGLPPLNMSSLTAAQLLILGNISNDGFSLTKKHRERHDPAWSHLDWSNGKNWVPMLLKNGVTTDIKVLCRLACTEFVFSTSLLTKLAAKGREPLVGTLSEDELQVFRNASLLDEVPSIETIKWWDGFRTMSRKIQTDANVAQGREAELWTMQNELKTVSQFGKKPIWVALDGDHYGYDILSFRESANSLPNVVLIEVKSFASKAQPRVFITRNEWDKALESAPNYIFVVWCMELKEFRTYTVFNLLPHIPSDNAYGRWQNVEVTIQNW